jgi:hypothetical protein
MRYRDLVEDGHVPGLLVHPDWWEPKHPQEIPVEIDDPIALHRPAPEISIPTGYGDPENLDGNQTPRDTYEVGEIIDVFNRSGVDVFDPAADAINPDDPGAQYLTVLSGNYFRPILIGDALGSALDPATGLFSRWPAFIHERPLSSFDQYVMVEVKDHIQVADVFGAGFYLMLSMQKQERVSFPEGPNGYYFYVSPDWSGNSVLGTWYRWTNGAGGSIVTQASVPAPGGDITGWRVRGERVGNTLSAYYDDGTGWQTWIAPFLDPSPRPQELYVGLAMEDDGPNESFLIDGFYAGTFTSGPEVAANINTTLVGGETSVAFTEAVMTEPWNDWIFIERDDTTLFASRMVEGFASTGDRSPVFFVRFTTPFSGSTATAGNNIRFAPAPPPAAPPVPENLNVTDVTVQEFSTAPTLNNKVAGYELQVDGNAYAVTSEDDGAGLPNFSAQNPLTDWIDYKSYVGTYHCRMTNTGGSASLGQGTLNTWLEIGVDACIWTIENGNGSGFQNWTGTIEVSDDGGSTTADSASITLETDEI